MKKIGSILIPVAIFFVIFMLGNRMFLSGNVNPVIFILIGAVLILVLFLTRPKATSPKTSQEMVEQVLGEFAQNAFSDDSQLSNTFRSALSDSCGNRPKAALSKLEKLASQCRTKEESYAVAMATALCHNNLRNYDKAILEYNRAIVLYPTSDLAVTIGSCHQRLGQLEQAQDSYEFALDLDAKNVEARSSLATTYVANRDYDTALEHAMLALELDEAHSSALATAAICFGLQGDQTMYKHYTELAVKNGYSREKIQETVSALKKK